MENTRAFDNLLHYDHFVPNWVRVDFIYLLLSGQVRLIRSSEIRFW